MLSGNIFKILSVVGCFVMQISSYSVKKGAPDPVRQKLLPHLPIQNPVRSLSLYARNGCWACSGCFLSYDHVHCLVSGCCDQSVASTCCLGVCFPSGTTCCDTMYQACGPDNDCCDSTISGCMEKGGDCCYDVAAGNCPPGSHCCDTTATGCCWN